MAPGYRSPFDHAPSPKPIHNTDGMIPIIAILLCVSIILCLALFTFHAAPRHNHHEYHQLEVDVSVPAQEMALDHSIPKYFAMRSGEDPWRTINIRDLFPHEESHVDDVQRPLLRAETYNSSPGELVETVTQRENGAHEGSVNWHGTNTLNTSWGWMA